MRPLRGLLAPLVLISLPSGCLVGPDYSPPSPEISDAFHTGLEGATPPSGEAAVGRWWRRLNDPVLDSLMDRAIASNLDLQLAEARLAEARGRRNLVSSGLFPRVGASAAVGYGTSDNVVRHLIAPPLNTAIDTEDAERVSHAAGFDASWEIDLFGRVRRQVEAGNAMIRAATEDRRGVLVTVLADVGRAYVEMRGLQRRLEIARRTTASYLEVVEVVRLRERNGLATELDVALAERQHRSSEALLLPLSAEIAERQRRLAVLLGLGPEELYEELRASAALPAPPPDLALGLPSDLLRRRPDIREAERELAAANARIGEATAEYFPQFTLTGALGYQGQGLGVSSFDPRFIYSVGPGVRWPILDFGKVRAGVEVQVARMEQVLTRYRQVVLAAVREVDDALGRYLAERDRFEHLRRATETADRASLLALRRFEGGLTDMLHVLDAQREQYRATDQLAISEEMVLVHWVTLNKALGGGWEGIEAREEP